MAKKVGKTLVLGLGLLLGAVVGAWLSLVALYSLLEPAERASGALFIIALAALLVGLLFVARKLFGRAGLVALVVVLAATSSAWMLL